MAFIPNTDDDRRIMLEKIGVRSFEELIDKVPENLRLKDNLNLPPRLSEYEAVKLLDKYAKMNANANTHTCFMGGGAYDRFIPSIVGAITERPEFKTAYTPYQAEVSQGTLQAMYEFQSLICRLTAMDVSNASLYDGGSALAEACLLAANHNRKKEILIAGTVNPYFKMTARSITAGKELIFKEFVANDGTADIIGLKAAINENTSAVIVQQPNFYGNLEDIKAIEKITHEMKALLISVIEPISLGLIQPPGDYNADIAVGEGQPLGINLSFGGPYLGIFACKKEFVRKIPGRIAGITEDENGNRGFVLTLQTREQQIKREKATSNICTNQGLFMLAATVYMESMGKEGIREVAEQSMHKAHYLAGLIKDIPGFSLMNDKPFFSEFLVKTPVPAQKILAKGVGHGILAGIATERFPGYIEGLLIAVTEKRSKEELDGYAEFLSTFAS
ncbi:MAG: aminomethyl-transferring glycine dehydrogenase subunit GcvPA [Candidatus Kapaibacterium sp.]